MTNDTAVAKGNNPISQENYHLETQDEEGTTNTRTDTSARHQLRVFELVKNGGQDPGTEGEKCGGEKCEGAECEGENNTTEKCEGENNTTEKYEGEKYEVEKYETEKFEGEKYETEKYETEKYETEKFEAEKYETEKFEAEKCEGEKFDENNTREKSSYQNSEGTSEKEKHQEYHELGVSFDSDSDMNVKLSDNDNKLCSEKDSCKEPDMESLSGMDSHEGSDMDLHEESDLEFHKDLDLESSSDMELLSETDSCNTGESIASEAIPMQRSAQSSFSAILNRSPTLSHMSVEGLSTQAAPSNNGSHAGQDMAVEIDLEEEHENIASPRLSFDAYRQLVSESGETPIEITNFINSSVYKQIFLGKISTKQKPHVRITRKGPMSEQEKSLFDHVNTILQYPPCVEHVSTRLRSKATKSYRHAISKYVIYMASQGFTKETFKVDGFYISNFLREWINRHDKTSSETQTHCASISRFQFALKMLHILTGIEKLRHCQDEHEFCEKFKEFQQIPNFYKVEALIRERKAQPRVMPEMNFNNKARLLQARYTPENVKSMMQCRLNQTGSMKKKDIYDGINGKLEFLLGHHYLFRSSSKCSLELSDFLWNEERTEGQNVRVLGFQIPDDETNSSSPYVRKAGSIRHKDIHLCFISIFAMSLWYRFDFGSMYAPLVGDNFPNFLSKEDWYPIKVLFSIANLKGRKPISYRYNNTLSAETIASIGFTTIKKTEVTKVGKVQLADATNIEDLQIKRAGFWYREMLEGNCISNYPFEFLKLSAGFEADEPYVIGRDIPVPEELQKLIFPWLESAIQIVSARTDQDELPYSRRDDTVGPFLAMLKDFRSIIIQDLVIMVGENSPPNVFSQHHITKDARFLDFKAQMNSIMLEQAHLHNEKMDHSIALASPLFAAELKSIKTALDVQKVREMTVQNTLLSQFSDMNNKLAALTLSSVLTEDIQTTIRSNIAEAVSEIITPFQAAMASKITALETQVIKMHDDQKTMSEKNLVELSRLVSVGHGEDEPMRSKKRSRKGECVHSTLGPHASEDSGPSEQALRLQEIVRTPSPARDSIYSLTPNMQTVVDLYYEWYVDRDGLLCVQERDERYGKSWRQTNPTVGLYKRRKALINFMEYELAENSKFADMNRHTLANLVELYRRENKMKFNVLCTHTQNEDKRLMIRKDLEELREKMKL